MTKQNTRNKILEHGARMIRMKGFNNTGIQEILNSAGVPKGSFYFYFKSKDDLGLALIDYYAESLAQLGASLLRKAEGSPLERLQKFFQGMRQLFEQDEWRSGCPIGNLTQEMGLLSETFRAKLKAVFEMMQSYIRECLDDGRSQSEIDERLDPDELAQFILDSWEGGLLRMKAEGNSGPLVLFEKMIFGHVLKR
ncbi:MAG: TetR family transcriptional regulator C-terminal domain-containing protein [Pseudomonadota bacterium]